MKSKSSRLTGVSARLVTVTFLFLIISPALSFNWPWEDPKPNPKTAEEILSDYEESSEPKDKEESSFWDSVKSWTGTDGKESKENSSFFDKFRFWEKEKEEKKQAQVNSKLLDALEVNAEEIASKRDFMNDLVDTDPEFEHMEKSLEQIEYFLVPVRRFQELDEKQHPDEFIDYPSTFIRRLTLLLTRMYGKRDDLKLQIAILATNTHYFVSPNFEFGVFFEGAETRAVWDVVRAKRDPRLEKYAERLDKLRFRFGTQIREVDELRKETDANLHLFYDALDEISRIMNTQNQMFFETFADADIDVEKEQREQVVVEVKKHLRDLIDRRARVLDAANQIRFILKEVGDIGKEVSQLYKDSSPTAQLIVVELRQRGKGENLNSEEFFKKQDETGQNKFLRDKVVKQIVDGETQVQDIEDTDISKAVLTPTGTDPQSEDDPYLHLRNQSKIDKVVSQQEKDNIEKENNKRGKTQEEEDEVGFIQ